VLLSTCFHTQVVTIVSADSHCKSCSSPNLINLNAEICLHFSGPRALHKAPIFVFPSIEACLDCGFLQSSLSTADLSHLTDATKADAALELTPARLAKPAHGDDMQKHDGRKEERSPSHSEALVFTGAESASPDTVSTENLNSYGARLRTERPSKPNAPISVKFPKKEWVQARVVYCERVPDKSFAIGVEFVRRQPS
jgi:hypothetical protein